MWIAIIIGDGVKGRWATRESGSTTRLMKKYTATP